MDPVRLQASLLARLSAERAERAGMPVDENYMTWHYENILRDNADIGIACRWPTIPDGPIHRLSSQFADSKPPTGCLAALLAVAAGAAIAGLFGFVWR